MNAEIVGTVRKKERKLYFNKIKKQKGITLIALVVTIIVLLILAGISIIMLTGENGILTRAAKSREETEKQNIIEQARIKISEKQTDNLGTLTGRELTEILTQNYGTLSGEGTVLEKTLTTTDGKYNIPVKEIYNGLLTLEKGKCVVGGELEINFTEGDTWNDVYNQLSNWWKRYGYINGGEAMSLFSNPITYALCREGGGRHYRGGALER